MRHVLTTALIWLLLSSCDMDAWNRAKAREKAGGGGSGELRVLPFEVTWSGASFESPQFQAAAGLTVTIAARATNVAGVMKPMPVTPVTCDKVFQISLVSRDPKTGDEYVAGAPQDYPVGPAFSVNDFPISTTGMYRVEVSSVCAINGDLRASKK